LSIAKVAALWFLVLAANETALAVTVVNLGTPGNAASWLITGGGASMAPAFQVLCDSTAPGCISPSSNGNSTGTLISGFLVSNSSFWYADNTFSIPAGATGISLSFSGLVGDDRVVLQLNGANIGNFCCAGGLTAGDGIMSFNGSTYVNPFDFTNTVSGTVTSGFVVGGANTLRLVENNTFGGTNSSALDRNFAPNDNENASVVASVTYNAPLSPPPPAMPAPSSFVLLGAGMAVLTGWMTWVQAKTGALTPGSR
jgi:hypothetical protein